MDSVFVVQHLRVDPDGAENVKFIGVYRLLDSAQSAIERLKSQPGFCDASRIVDPLKDDDLSGFHIDEYEMDKDHWTEGFV
jgi:hypothetical protein